MKKFLKIVLIIGALIVALILGLNFYQYISKKVEVSKFSGVYRELAQQCLSASS